MVEYIQENNEEQLTINDLVMLMDEQLKNNPHEAFSSKWMKYRLMEQLQNDIVISEINGISVIVTLRKKASHVLREFYDQQKSSDIEEEKRRIIVAVAKLIKSEIKEVNEESAHYPSTTEIEHSSEYIPKSLSLLLKKLFVVKGSTVGHACYWSGNYAGSTTKSNNCSSSNWYWCSDAQTLWFAIFN